MPIRQFISKLTPKGWAMVGGAVAISIVFLMLVMNFASKPSYTTIMTAMDPAQTGKITSALDAKGIGYQIEDGGTALGVTSGQVSQARIALASANLLSSSTQPGFELLDKSQLGASNFQQQVTYERALEGQLDNTIDQIQGVDSAQVNLVIPDQQDQLFADTSQSASASVLLGGSASNLDSGAVRGIAQLVASSVPGLTSSKVTITDSSGAALWPSSNSDSGTSGGLPAAQSADQQYDATTAAQVDAMLTQTLGANKAEVVVNGDLNDNQATQQSLSYAKKGVPLTQSSTNETLTGSGASAASGTAGAIPSYSTGTTTGSGSGSNYKNTSTNTSYGVDKTITNSTIAAGAINRQTVSVLVSNTVPAASIPAIKSAVAGAVGLNAKRGDLISVSQIAFAKPVTTTATAGGTTKMIGYAKYGAAGLGSLIFLFMTTRMLRRRERESVSQPTWLSELATPRPLAALGGGGDAPTQVRQLGSAPANVPKQQIEALIDREPDRVAQQVKAWMAED